MFTPKQEKGQEGEQLAADYLQAKGYRLLARNFRRGRSEVDLIVSDGRFLVFVEVKLRTDTRFGFPEQAVDQSKRHCLLRAARSFLHEQPDLGLLLRFDVVSIDYEQGAPRLLHFEDAFH